MPLIETFTHKGIWPRSRKHLVSLLKDITKVLPPASILDILELAGCIMSRVNGILLESA